MVEAYPESLPIHTRTKLAVIITEHDPSRIPFLMDALLALNYQTFPSVFGQKMHVILMDDSGGNVLQPLMQRIVDTNTFPKMVYNFTPEGMQFGIDELDPGVPVNFLFSYLKPPERLGTSAICATAIKFVNENLKPKYIAFQDGDDVSLYTRFEKQVELLDKHDVYIACSTDKLEFGHNHQGYQTKFNPDPEALRITGAFFGACHYKSSLMIRSEYAENLFDPQYKHWGDDIIMNSRISQMGYSAIINQPLLYYRRHPNQLSNIDPAESSACYKKAVGQSILECTGEAVSDAFLDNYYNIFHQYNNILLNSDFKKRPKEEKEKMIAMYDDKFVKEAIKILTKCDFINKAKLEFLLNNLRIQIKKNLGLPH